MLSFVDPFGLPPLLTLATSLVLGALSLLLETLMVMQWEPSLHHWKEGWGPQWQRRLNLR